MLNTQKNDQDLIQNQEQKDHLQKKQENVDMKNNFMLNHVIKLVLHFMVEQYIVMDVHKKKLSLY